MTGYTPPRWSMTPMRATRRRWSDTGSSPSTLTVPALARRYPSNVSTVEVLPAPLGPRSATTWPRAADTDRPSTARRAPYRTTRSTHSTAGVIDIAARLPLPTMIDIRLARENPDAVKAALARRGVDLAEVERLLDADRRARHAVGRRDEVRSKVKELSRQVGEARRTGDESLAGALAEESRARGDEVAAL